MTTAITKKKNRWSPSKTCRRQRKKNIFFWVVSSTLFYSNIVLVCFFAVQQWSNSLTHSTFNILLLLLFTLSFGCWLCSFILIEWVDNPKRKKNCTVLLPLTRWQWQEKTDRNVKKEADTRTQTANKQQIFLLVLIH